MDNFNITKCSMPPGTSRGKLIATLALEKDDEVAALEKLRKEVDASYSVLFESDKIEEMKNDHQNYKNSEEVKTSCVEQIDQEIEEVDDNMELENELEINDDDNDKDYLSGINNEVTETDKSVEAEEIEDNMELENELELNDDDKDKDFEINNEVMENDESEDDTTENTETVGKHCRTRKRKPDKQKWKREENKMKRQKGEQYQGTQRSEEGKWMADKERPARKLKPACSCKLSAQNTKLQCRMFSDVDRAKIHENFWKHMTWSEKKVFVRGLVDVVPAKNKKNKVREISHRTNTLVYHLKKDGLRLRVCRTMLLNTLAIGSWSLQNWAKSLVENDETEIEKVPNRKSARIAQDRAELRTFFESLPKMESHYCRATSRKLYLEPIWQSKMSLYNQYKQYCTEKEIHPLSIKTFHDEFAELNLSLFRPKKDQCDLCLSFKTGNTTEEVYKQHLMRKNSARAEKTEDKENAQHVYTMDLQSTLLCPMLKASAIYYKKKLVVHNFTLYNLKTKDAYCFLWNEVEGQITANEFSSIIYHFLKTKANVQPGEEVILYSDGCSYQNRNSTLSNTLLHLANEKNIIITQKYLVPGHTQMECDSMHSCIERRLRNREIYSPACYISAAKEARIKPKPFEVEYLRHTFFKKFSGLNYYTSIRPGSKPGDPTVVDLCALQYTSDLQIKYKLEFSSEWKTLEKRTRRQKSSNAIDSLYKNQIPIKKSKYDHLQQLKDVIPLDYHLFYDTLPYIVD